MRDENIYFIRRFFAAKIVHIQKKIGYLQKTRFGHGRDQEF